MNLYTVRKATQGLADYLNASGLPKKVAIAHDSRHNGALFARRDRPRAGRERHYRLHVPPA